MRIERAIVATEGTPMYSECWPLVAKAWLNLGVTPVVANIGNTSIDTTVGECLNFEEIPGVPSGFVSQVIRMIVPSFFPNDVCILSDIDMVPMRKSYFKKELEQYNEDSILVLTSDAYKVDYRYPVCYIVAKGILFQELIGLKDTKEDTIIKFIQELYNLNLGWDTDELYLGKCIKDYSLRGRVHFLNRFSWEDSNRYPRLDRAHWKISRRFFIKNKYVDCHLLRPPSEYKNELQLVNLFVANNNNVYIAIIKYSLFKVVNKLITIKSKLFL